VSGKAGMKNDHIEHPEEAHADGEDGKPLAASRGE